VQVRDVPASDAVDPQQERLELQQTLARIGHRLTLLEQRLEAGS